MAGAARPARAPDPVRPAGLSELDGAELGQLGQGMARVDLAEGARLRAHDEGLGGRAVVVVADALEQLAVGDAGRGEEAVVPRDEVVGREHLVEVVAGVERRGALVLVAGPQPTLDLARPCT